MHVFFYYAAILTLKTLANNILANTKVTHNSVGELQILNINVAHIITLSIKFLGLQLRRIN